MSWPEFEPARELAIKQDVIRFKSAEPCKRHPQPERYTSTGLCANCQDERNKANKAKRR